MKSNKKQKNILLYSLFKDYLIQCVVCSGIILVLSLALHALLQWLLEKYVPDYYMVYRSLYLGAAAVIDRLLHLYAWLYRRTFASNAIVPRAVS